MNKYTNKPRKVTPGAVRRRKKLIREYTALIIVLAILIAMIPAFMSVKAGSKGSTVTSCSVYTIQKDDTLWEIAGEITENGQDVRQTVYNIRKLNNLNEKDELMPGQQIVLPYSD